MNMNQFSEPRQFLTKKTRGDSTFDILSLAKKAWLSSRIVIPEDQTGNRQAMFDMLADDVVLRCGIPDGTPISGEFHGRQAVIDFYTLVGPSLVEDDRIEAPLRFGCSGDRAVIVGMESFAIKKSDVAHHNREFATVLDFRDGLIARILQIRDYTSLVKASRSQISGT